MEEIEADPYLTDRERIVFGFYYRRDWRIEDIAAELNYSRSTINKVLRNIRRKIFES